MSPASPKLGRVVLKGDEYLALKRSILDRDEWRCRLCARRSMLEVHHVIKRSKIRLDLDWNLCTLCNPCHRLLEDNRIAIIGVVVEYGPGVVGVDTNRPIQFIVDTHRIHVYTPEEREDL